MDATHPAAASGAAAAAKQPAKVEEPAETKETWNDRVKTVAGLVAVLAGVVAVGVIAIVAMLTDKEGTNVSTIATSAAGVIATIVGAYFGVKLGSDQTKDASKSQKGTAAKAEVYAAHLPADKAQAVIDLADEAAEKAMA
ncbi:MAG TPA: hypothetical protein VF081_10940 [Solirubrobacterales bacterium]